MKKTIIIAMFLSVLLIVAPAYAWNSISDFTGNFAQVYYYGIEGCESTAIYLSASESIIFSTPTRTIDETEHTEGVYIGIGKYDVCLLPSSGTQVVDDFFPINNDDFTFDMDTARLNTTIEAIDNEGNPLTIPISLEWKGVGKTEVTREKTKGIGIMRTKVEYLRSAVVNGNIGDYVINNISDETETIYKVTGLDVIKMKD